MAIKIVASSLKIKNEILLFPPHSIKGVLFFAYFLSLGKFFNKNIEVVNMVYVLIGSLIDRRLFSFLLYLFFFKNQIMCEKRKLCQRVIRMMDIFINSFYICLWNYNRKCMMATVWVFYIIQ